MAKPEMTVRWYWRHGDMAVWGCIDGRPSAALCGDASAYCVIGT
jgi:hypothetical protein